MHLRYDISGADLIDVIPAFTILLTANCDQSFNMQTNDNQSIRGVFIETPMDNIEEITVQHLASIYETGSKPLYLLDVREPRETRISQLPGAINIPIGEIPKRINELDINGNWIVFCRTGKRSARVCQYLIDRQFKSVKNLKGGINTWARRIDPSIPVY